MKRIWAALILIIILLIPAYASANTSAKSAIATEATTGRILYEKNINERLPMASTTKIMTALVAIENSYDKLDDLYEVSDTAAGIEGSSMYLEQGEKMTLRELLYGLMLPSGNDAAVAIAEIVGGSVEDFVNMMNEKAVELSLTDTHFTNPNGLPDDNHYSTAHNMAKMTEHAMKSQIFREIVSAKTYKISGEGKSYSRTLTNHNKLLRLYDGCIGVKTGFTKAAGRCLVSSAERNGMTLICVTLNAPDDWNDHMNILSDAFSTYTMKEIVNTDNTVGNIEVANGVEASVALYPKYGFHYPLRDNEQVVTDAEYPQFLSAPVNTDTETGKITVRLNSQKIGEIPIITQTEIAEVSKIKTLSEILTERLRLFFFLWSNLL